MTEVLEIIRQRHSTRGAFDLTRPIEKTQLHQILEAARWAPTDHNMQNFEILIVDDKEKLVAVGQIPAELSEDFLRENYAQLSFSKEELLIKKRGMLASEFPPAWIDPEAWNPTSDYTSQLSFLARSVGETPLLLIVLYDATKRAPASEGDVLGHMSLGCVLENMWLASESLGVGFHVLTVFSNGRVQEQVKRLLHVPPQMKIAFACALGYPANSSDESLRVRRNLEDFIHHNQFGRKDLLWEPSRP